jgi:DNA polymerase III delta subunit
MSKFNKTMESIFDVTPSSIDENDNEIQEYIPKSSDQELSQLLDHDLKVDYEKTRDNIDLLISKGTEAVDNMLEIARQSEKARDFEVAGNMIKMLVESSKDLLEVQKRMRDMTGKTDSGTTNIKNAVFVGSTAELLKAMKEIKQGSIDG